MLQAWALPELHWPHELFSSQAAWVLPRVLRAAVHALFDPIRTHGGVSHVREDGALKRSTRY